MRIPVLAAIALFLLSLIVDGYILWDLSGISNRKKRKYSCNAYAAISIALYIFLIVIICLPKRGDASILPLMWMLFSYLSIYISKAVYCTISLLGRVLRKIFKTTGNYGVPGGIMASVVVFALMWVGVGVTRRSVMVNRLEISFPRIPDSFKGYRVVQFSDAHVGTWGNDTTFVSVLVDSINSLKPDIVLFTGDIVDRESAELKPFTPVLSRLSAPGGVYAVHGNHDYGAYKNWPSPGDAGKDVARLDSMMTSMGWKVLNNRAVPLVTGNDTISLLGVENWGEPPFNQLGKLDDSLFGNEFKGAPSITDSKFKILMTHNPEHWKQVVTQSSNIDLTLSGHTHAMQFMLEVGKWKWSPSKYRYKEWGGLYETFPVSNIDSLQAPMRLYVNIGCGEVGFPARIGAAKPEITLFTFK